MPFDYDWEPQEPDEPERMLTRSMAEPLPIDELLGKCRDRFHMVGVELEGAWTALPEGVTLERDGSVGGFSVPNNVGELPSPPLPRRSLANWMRRHYPDKVNKTCGLHVHMSFKSAQHYSWLMVPEFQATIKKYLRLWAINKMGFQPGHQLYERLTGNNSFCLDQFWPDVQAAARSKNYDHPADGPTRYTMIAYPFSLHSTIECRVLPMFEDVKEAISAVNAVLDITNASLAFLGMANGGSRGEKPLGAVVECDGTGVVEINEELV